MGQALYRKYRSKSLAEIVGQEHITQALSRAIEKGHISHAYLFTGPRGVGKTSIARILAYEVNKLPYDESATHLDIIEIDAASNRRIDEIRDLREKVHITPTSATYKVYIIDEVHMLTREAFNALLKTLEEPPAHALFILATTESHKLPETIVSRTQHYTFKPIDSKKVTAHLKYIAKQEKIKISDEALQLVASHGGGSFRDSISLLDQVKNYADSIDLKDVEQILGIAPNESIESLLDSIIALDSAAVMANITDLMERGIEAAILSEQLSEKLRLELLSNSPRLGKQTVLKLLGALIDIPGSPKPQLALEICLLEVVFENNALIVSSPEPKQIEKKPNKQIKSNPGPTETGNIDSKPITINPKTSEKTGQEETVEQPPVEAEVQQRAATGTFTAEEWSNVLTHIKKSHNTMYGILRMAVPTYTNSTLTLAFGFVFHQKRANDNRNKQIISDAIQELYGDHVQINCIVGEQDTSSSQDTKAKSVPSEPPALSTISGIFGGAELLES